MASFRPIGIWHPTRLDGKPAWVRPEPGPFPDHYATRRVLKLERNRPNRVCFFGESAAAGYLLAPEVTPAQVLEMRLGPEWEVVDLARTNERIGSLLETLEASLQLEPDILVVFTGNNWNLLETPQWSPLFPRPAARQRFAETVQARGLAGPVEEARSVVSERAARLFRAITATRIRTVVVIPEVNLADWTTRDPIPWLPEGVPAVNRWHALLARAEGALAQGRPARAREGARALLALDGGVSPTGFDLLSQAALRLGRVEEATLAARAGADSAHAPLLAQLAAPRARPFDQELLVKGSRRAGCEVVDLRETFAGRFGSCVGRGAFYDYCHLTPEGVDAAMTAVALRVGGESTSEPLRVPRAIEARAALGAAIHGAHRGAGGDIIRYWLERALEGSPETLTRLHDLVEARISASPAVFTAGQFRDAPLSPQEGWRWPHLDAEILHAASGLRDIRVLPDSPGQSRIELWNPLERFLPDVLEHRDDHGRSVVRAPWPRTDLALLAFGPCTVELVLRGRGRVGLFGWGHRLGTATLEGTWTRWAVALDVEPGLHRLTLRWPLPRPGQSPGLAEALQDLGEGFEHPIHPVFGEIHDMRVG